MSQIHYAENIDVDAIVENLVGQKNGPYTWTLGSVNPSWIPIYPGSANTALILNASGMNINGMAFDAPANPYWGMIGLVSRGKFYPDQNSLLSISVRVPEYSSATDMGWGTNNRWRLICLLSKIGGGLNPWIALSSWNILGGWCLGYNDQPGGPCRDHDSFQQANFSIGAGAYAVSFTGQIYADPGVNQNLGIITYSMNRAASAALPAGTAVMRDLTLNMTGGVYGGQLHAPVSAFGTATAVGAWTPLNHPMFDFGFRMFIGVQNTAASAVGHVLISQIILNNGVYSEF